MKNSKRLSKSSNFLLVVSKRISEYYEEPVVDAVHILMGLTYLDGPIKKYLNNFNINFEYIEDLFYKDNKKKIPFKLDLKKNTDFQLIEIGYNALVCIEKAADKKEILGEYVFPEDILFEIIKYDDADVMAVLDSKIDDISLFILGLTNELNDIKKNLRSRKDICDETPDSKENDSFDFINKYAINLVEEAKNGNIDIVSGRESEINRVIEILGRKNKSNPCLVGNAGVGKTAIVEGLALKIANGDVPDFLKNYQIFSLDIGLLLSGAKYRGDFEARLEGIINEIKENKNVILFLDEIHNIVSSGKSEDSIDAGNLLKPYLARGVIKCIGATTNKEYKNNIEKDSALERRFQKVQVEEPSISDCIDILEKSKSAYEKHHDVFIPKDVVRFSVELSDRYISDRYLPDKAFDLLDEACSRVKIKQSKRKLSKKDIIDVLYLWTGIVAEDLAADNSQKILGLDAYLKQNVIGQDTAIESISRAIMRSQAGLRDSLKPIASFIFSGPTGVGKTELAKCLSRFLFGNEKSLVRVDMSEYMEKISVSKLIGSAPGYVGYKEGGQLTESVRQKPYSVVLIDEIEKAHPDVLNIFLQILDEGIVTDGQGKAINFKNTILIFTSNLYNPYENKKTIGFPVNNNSDSNDNFQTDAIKKFSSAFSPEFVNRFDDIVVFNKLHEPEMIKIVDLLVNSLRSKLKKKGIKLTLTRKTKLFLLSKCNYSLMGARPLKRVLSKYVEDELSIMLLSGTIKKGMNVKITCKNNELKFNAEERVTKEEKLVSV